MADDDSERATLDSDKEPIEEEKPAAVPVAPSARIDADFWATARVVMPPPGKASVHLRLDSDVLDWFRQQGRGHLTRMNAVLRSYMEAHKDG